MYYSCCSLPGAIDENLQNTDGHAAKGLIFILSTNRLILSL
jgi:hypothetical protein